MSDEEYLSPHSSAWDHLCRLHARDAFLLGPQPRENLIEGRRVSFRTELNVPRVAVDDDERTDAHVLGELRGLGVFSSRSYEPRDDSVGAVHIDQSATQCGAM